MLLGKACALYPESADAHHALGLLVRRKQAEQGVRELARAAELAPGNSHYAYAYALGLTSTRQLDRALATLSDARVRFPENRQIESTLATPRALCAYLGLPIRGSERDLMGSSGPAAEIHPGSSRFQMSSSASR